MMAELAVVRLESNGKTKGESMSGASSDNGEGMSSCERVFRRANGLGDG